MRNRSVLALVLALAATTTSGARQQTPTGVYEWLAGGERDDPGCEHDFGESLAVVGTILFVGGGWDANDCGDGSEVWYPGVLSYDGLTGTPRHEFAGSYSAVAVGDRVLLNQRPPRRGPPITDFGVRLVDPDSGTTLRTYASPDARMPWNLRAMATIGDDFIALDGVYRYWLPPEAGEEWEYLGEDWRLVRVDGGTGAVAATYSLPNDFSHVRAVATNDDTVAAATTRWGDSAGGVFVFATDGTPRWSRRGPTTSSPRGFGTAVGLFGDDVLVGSPDQEDGSEAVYLFDGLTGALLRTFEDPDDDGGAFGWSVAARGNLLVVGDLRHYEPGHGRQGTAYVLDAATGAVIESLARLDPGDSYFGRCTAWMGDAIVSASANPSVGHPGHFNVFAPACRGTDPTHAEPCPPTTTSLTSTSTSTTLGPPTTSTTAPTLGCLAPGARASCDDGDPCTVDSCTELGCLWQTRAGVDAIRCVLDRRHDLAACSLRALPAAVTEAFTRVGNGVTSRVRSRRLMRLLAHARRSVRRAVRRGRMSDGCGQALLSIVATARARVLVEPPPAF
jgi:hypothetical protein